MMPMATKRATTTNYCKKKTQEHKKINNNHRDNNNDNTLIRQHVPVKAAAMGETDFEDYAADLQTQNSWALEAEVSDDGMVGWHAVSKLIQVQVHGLVSVPRKIVE